MRKPGRAIARHGQSGYPTRQKVESVLDTCRGRFSTLRGEPRPVDGSIESRDKHSTDEHPSTQTEASLPIDPGTEQLTKLEAQLQLLDKLHSEAEEWHALLTTSEEDPWDSQSRAFVAKSTSS